MTTERITLDGGWTSLRGVNGDDPAANTAKTEFVGILDSVDVPIVVLRRDFVLVCFNKAADALRILPSDIGRTSRDISVFGGSPRLEEHCSQVIASGVGTRVCFQDGHKWFVVWICPYTRSDGQVTGAVLTFTNVTAFRASIDQIIYERLCTRAIVNAVDDPLVVLSPDYRIQLANHAFSTMFFELASLRTQLKDTVASHVLQPVEVDHVFPGEGKRTLTVDARRLSLSGHPEHRILVTFQDVTARKQAEAANDLRAIAERKGELRRSEAFLAEAQRLSLTGSFCWRVTTDDITWSDQLYRIFQLEIGVPVTLELIRARVHPEDLILHERMTEEARSTGNDFEYEYRLMMPDGSIKYLHSVAHAARDQDGQLEYIAAVQDVTEQVLARVKLENAVQEIKQLKDRLQDENVALREQVDQAFMFEEILGASSALKAVLSRVSKVAATDSTVLLMGETGTGKELVARAIHKRSQRFSHAFVSVNCAAIPTSLIASELFGHEKGAFTGASARRVGRFELAHGGTIFLDEVGELPMETQVALLRVLQERQFERVGGSASIRVDVRVIAATNRDLQAAVEAGTFRSDLFYRLNVFPLAMPALRERADDIPLLVEYFIDRYARKAGKTIRRVNRRTLTRLRSYPWPGNVRELQNVIERSVIVCDTDEFTVDETWLSAAPELETRLGLSRTLASHERQIIEEALRASRGRIYGPSGAAARLGVARSTLDSKIQALGIDKNRFRERPARQ